MARLGLVQLGLVEDGGATRAKRLADIYIKTHSNAEGKVVDPMVYQTAIDTYLLPFSDDLTVQSKIATLQNNVKNLATDNSEISVTLDDLKMREHSAWYVDEDEVDSTGFRNPAYVAQVTSESLDMLVAETVASIQVKAANGKDTTEIETYLRDLVKRADRMRNLSMKLDDGVKEDMDGYGYYVDVDPNTGAARGASLMPTDVGVKDIGSGTIRTDTNVQVGNKRIPLYLPYVKDAQGQTHVKFAGREYTGDTNLLQSSDSSDVILSDRNAIPYDGDTFQRGKVYRSFNGKTNIDGSPKQDFYFVGYDNKMYRFADDDPQGKAFLDSMQTTGGLNTSSIPRISPYTAASVMAEPLPKDDMQFTQKTQRGIKIDQLTQQAQSAQAESDRLNNMSTTGQVWEGIKGFFSRKNKPSTPNPAPERTPGDTIDQQGGGFFRSRVTPTKSPFSI